MPESSERDDAGSRKGSDSNLEDTLSRRELEIVRLVAAGRPNREIANLLLVVESTVTRHLRRIYEKLEIGGRRSLVALARKEGLR